MTEEELNKEIKTGNVEEVGNAEQAPPTSDNEIDFLKTTLGDYESFLNLLKKLKQYSEDAPTHTPKSFIEQFYFRVEGAGGTNTLYAYFNGGWNAFLQGTTDHGALTGLVPDDDHTQYHTDARGDARYYTETEMNAGQMDSRYYTETEMNAGQMDTRYYTETEIDNTAVKLTGNQTIADVKTFSSFPVTPSAAPTSNYQTANKKYVDDNLDVKFVGVGSSANKTYYNITLPWRVLTTNEPVWDVVNATISEQCLAHIVFYRTAVGDAYIQTQDALFQLGFDDSKKIIMECVVEVDNVAHTFGWGLCEAADKFGETTGDGNRAAVHFCVGDGGAGKLYAIASDGDGNLTTSEITGITFANKNLYRIEWNPGVSALFYVNGNLEATITTDLPSAGNILFGVGIQESSIFMSAPHLAIEM